MGQKAKQQRRKSLEIRAAARDNESRIAKKPSAALLRNFPSSNILQNELPPTSSPQYIEGVTMDKPGTILMDDGFSLLKLKQGWRLQVSIVDLPSLIADGCALEETASQLRKQYADYDGAPVHRIFPYDMLRAKASLQPGKRNPTITFDITLDNDFNLTNSSIYRSIFTNRCSYDFNSVDEKALLGKSPELAEWLSFGHSLFQKRVNDAVAIAQKKLGVQNAGGMAPALPNNRIPKSKVLVGEILILANKVAAQYIAQNNLVVPTVRKIPALDVSYVSPCYEFDRHVNERVSQIAQVVTGSNGDNVRVTSPMRNYNEFLGLKVIAAHLCQHRLGAYSAKMIKTLCAEFQHNAEPQQAILKDDWKRHWGYAFTRQRTEQSAFSNREIVNDPYIALRQECREAGLADPIIAARKIETCHMVLHVVGLSSVPVVGKKYTLPAWGIAAHPYDALMMAVNQYRQSALGLQAQPSMIAKTQTPTSLALQ